MVDEERARDGGKTGQRTQPTEREEETPTARKKRKQETQGEVALRTPFLLVCELFGCVLASVLKARAAHSNTAQKAEQTCMDMTKQTMMPNGWSSHGPHDRVDDGPAALCR
jgi:uncharacterized protein HemX